jgi:hypothetical protein
MKMVLDVLDGTVIWQAVQQRSDVLFGGPHLAQRQDTRPGPIVVDNYQSPLCCVSQRLPQIFFLQIRVGLQYLVFGSASREKSHNHANRDTHTAYARFATHDGGIERDALQLIHIGFPFR